MSANGTEIVFFDVETTMPSRSGERFALLEFGAILVCPRRVVEVGCYSTLIRPSDLAAVSPHFIRCKGISPGAVSAAPTFRDVADRVFDVLNGRVWAGHNIVWFDCPRITEAFEELGRAAPEPKGIIDTFYLLAQKFGRRAGDMKMASLATYFGLGQQKHRSLDDVRMNLEVLKYCAAVLFLEISLPDVFSLDNLVPSGITSRTEAYWNASGSLQQNLCSASDEFNDQQINRHILNTSDHAGPSVDKIPVLCSLPGGISTCVKGVITAGRLLCFHKPNQSGCFYASLPLRRAAKPIVADPNPRLGRPPSLLRTHGFKSCVLEAVPRTASVQFMELPRNYISHSSKVLRRLSEMMKHEVDVGLISEYANFRREKLMKLGAAATINEVRTQGKELIVDDLFS